MPAPEPEWLRAHNERMNNQAQTEWNARHPGVIDMPKVSQMLISKFINKGDVDPPLVMTIRQVTFDQGDGKFEQPKWLMWFNEHRKPLKLNNTILKYLEATLGEESDDWRGKRVQIYNDPTVMMGNELVGGVRMRANKSDIINRGARPAMVVSQQQPQATLSHQEPDPLLSQVNWAVPTQYSHPQPQQRATTPQEGWVDQQTGEISTREDFDDDIAF